MPERCQTQLIGKIEKHRADEHPVVNAYIEIFKAVPVVIKILTQEKGYSQQEQYFNYFHDYFLLAYSLLLVLLHQR